MRSSGSAGMRIVIVDRRVHEEQRQCRLRIVIVN